MEYSVVIRKGPHNTWEGLHGPLDPSLYKLNTLCNKSDTDADIKVNSEKL